MAEEVKLFKTWSSPFGFRIVWALKLKGIPYDFVDEDLKNKSPLLLQYNPIHKKIPVLVHNGKPVVESIVILEYIEDTWKQYSLLPQDPYLRARARFWAKFGDDKVLPSIWGAFNKQGKDEEEAILSAWENLQFLEEELKGKKFFGGDCIGIVDIVLGWLAYLVPIFEEILKVKFIDEQRFPALSSWTKEFLNAPVIKENLPPHHKLVTKFRAIREEVLAES